MTISDILRYRLINQQLAGTTFKAPAETVGWMGAMQAQDYAMAKWAVGARLHGAADALIEQAIDNGAVIRTHILRPTWHLVATKDIRWMMALSAPRLRPLLNANNKKLELTEAVFNKSNKLIEKALEGNKQFSRKELMYMLEKNKIATNDLRSIHIMYRAEVDGVVCNGARKGKEHTYALFDERIPAAREMDRDAAVAELMLRYMASHGPATVPDFVWWSGLTGADAKTGLQLNKDKLNFVNAGGQTYWFADDLPSAKLKKGTIHFLPAFDEYMVSYKDRSAVLPHAYFSNAISANGIFKPIIAVDGKVTGTWKRTIKKDAVIMELSFFDPAKTPRPTAIEKAIQSFERFLGLRAEVVFKP